MLKKSFLTSILLSLTATNVFAQSIEIPNLDQKDVIQNQITTISNSNAIPDMNVDKNLPLEEFRRQLQQKLQARLNWYKDQRNGTNLKQKAQKERDDLILILDDLKNKTVLNKNDQKDGYNLTLGLDERIANYKQDAIQHLIYSSIKQKPELYLDLYPSEQLDRLLVKVDNNRLDLIPVVKLNHITQKYAGNMQEDDKYQFLEEIKVELKDSLDKLQIKEREELEALTQLKNQYKERINKIDAIIDKARSLEEVSNDDFQQLLLEKLIKEKLEINTSLQSTVAKIATVKQKYADLMVKARNEAGIKIADKLISKE